jgi:hypothetical protein
VAKKTSFVDISQIRQLVNTECTPSKISISYPGIELRLPSPYSVKSCRDRSDHLACVPAKTPSMRKQLVIAWTFEENMHKRRVYVGKGMYNLDTAARYSKYKIQLKHNII